MAGIAELTLRNFRGFAALEKLRLAPLTFLVGPNSSGKSSIADALLFMAQSGFLSVGATKPIWVGPLVDLGSFSDTVFQHDQKLTLYASALIEGARGLSPLRGKWQMDAELSVEVTRATDTPDEGRLKRLTIRDPESGDAAELRRRKGRYESFDAHANGQKETYEEWSWGGPGAVLGALLKHGRSRHRTALAELLDGPWLKRFASSIQRVSSGREPPRRSYERNAGKRDHNRLDRIDPTAISQQRVSLADGLAALGIAHQVRVKRLSEYHDAVMLQDSVTGVQSNLADVGYGASQVIPVLEGCAAPGPGPLFVEQPEIHLHPQAQGELAEILCKASSARQMIVETHSEHMINRARRLIAEGSMEASHVIIQYIDRGNDGSSALAIDVDDKGDFKQDWPNGFYDERYNETMRIAAAQAGRAARDD